MNKKAVEIVKAGANVVYERGLWSKEERKNVKNFFAQNGVETELHYVRVSDELWKKQIAERNEKVAAGKGGSDFYLDDGLMKKMQTLFQEPTKDEIDVFYSREN